jgi:hypothetical protein
VSHAVLDAPHRRYALSLPIGWRACAQTRRSAASSSILSGFSFERFLSVVHYNDIDNSKLEDRSNERIPYVFGGEEKLVRERYIRVAATVIVINAGDKNICV